MGNETLDAQHRQLLEYVNELHRALSENKASSRIEETMLFLDGYTYGHFDFEEMYMRAHDYPGLDEHIAKHREFVKRYRQFKFDLLIGKVSPQKLAPQVADFIGRWWVDHICLEDRKYYLFIKKREKND